MMLMVLVHQYSIRGEYLLIQQKNPMDTKGYAAHGDTASVERYNRNTER